MQAELRANSCAAVIRSGKRVSIWSAPAASTSVRLSCQIRVVFAIANLATAARVVVGKAAAKESVVRAEVGWLAEARAVAARAEVGERQGSMLCVRMWALTHSNTKGLANRQTNVHTNERISPHTSQNPTPSTHKKSHLLAAHYMRLTTYYLLPALMLREDGAADMQGHGWGSA